MGRMDNISKYFKYFDWVVLFSCIAGFVIEFLCPSIADVAVHLLGWFGAGYCLCYLIIFFGLPIKRDWILAKGHFLIKVVNFVLLIPFVLTLIFSEVTIEGKGLSSQDLIATEVAADDAEVSAQDNKTLFWAVYLHFMDAGNQSMANGKTARNISALIAILGFLLLNGLLISTLINWFDRHRDQWINGEIIYKRFKRRWSLSKHYVVIGGGDEVVGVVNQLMNEKEGCLPYVIIQTSSDIDALRRKLFSALHLQKQKQHIVLYYGSSTSKEDLSQLGLNNAQEVYIIGENSSSDDADSYHDTVNMECLSLLRDLYIETPNGKKITARIDEVNKFRQALATTSDEEALRSEPNNRELEKWWGDRPRLQCRVMFEYQTTFSVFQFFDVDEQMTTYIEFEPFNYYEMWAQKVLINREVEKESIKDKFNRLEDYLPLEGSEGITRESDDYVHLFVVGMSRMGVAMGIEAAHLAHYPNYTEEKKIRTKITFIDTNASANKDFFIGRFSDLFKLSHWRYGSVEAGELKWEKRYSPDSEAFGYLGGDFIDVEWEFINSGLEQRAVQDYILSSTRSKARVTIAICFPESNRAHAAALYLDKRIYESDRLLQVLVYNRNGSAIINAITQNNKFYPYCGKIRSFGCSSECVVKRYIDISEFVGRQIDRAYNKSERKAIEKVKAYEGKSKGAMLWSSIYNGNTLWTKLRSIGFNPQNPVIDENAIQTLADVEHNRWNVEELLMNFRYLTSAEQADVIANKLTKNQMKSKMAHLNICSNKRLLEIDKGAQRYDKDLTAVLGEIYQKLKQMDEESKRA